MIDTSKVQLKKGIPARFGSKKPEIKFGERRSISQLHGIEFTKKISESALPRLAKPSYRSTKLDPKFMEKQRKYRTKHGLYQEQAPETD